MRRFFVVAPDGQRYGPADLATLNVWIGEGRLLPNQMLQDEMSGQTFMATSLPGLNFGPGIAAPPGNMMRQMPPVRPASGALLQVPAGTHPVALVVILSLFVGPWLGMILNRQVAKGLVLGLFGTFAVGFICCWGLPIWWIVTLVDAILIAQRLNRGETVGEWQWF